MTEETEYGRRDLEHVGDLVDGVVASLGGRVGLSDAALLWKEWPAVATGDWAAAEPVRLDDGVLLVAVSDGMTATRLRYETAGLIGRIGARIGQEVVSSVRIKVQRPMEGR